jgi:xanthine/CO dehydrogenase XdhC/CoxF family maturation factor
MKELESIVAHAERARVAGSRVALATVIGIDGSSYRLPGARMLIVDGKWIAGSISGGCLEDDVVLRAGEVIGRAEPVIATYDTTSDDDIVFGVGLGCKGVIDIFIEPIAPAPHAVDFLGFAKDCLRERQRGIAATVIRALGLDAKPGSRLLLREGSAASDIADAALIERLRREIEHAPGQPSRTITIALERGSADVFVEHIEPPTPLLVFGAGHDAVPVVRLAKEIGWHVTLIDHRPGYGNAARFPDADRIVVCQPHEVPKAVALTGDTVTLLMTHNYLRDRDLLEILLPTPVRYIGLLGPRRRADDLLAELKEKGTPLPPEQLARLYAPVGLDIGSEGPAEVALSILAEVQAVMTSHRGGHLRERKRPIHQS